MIKYSNEFYYTQMVTEQLLKNAPKNVSASIEPYTFRSREHGVNTRGNIVWLLNGYQIFYFQQRMPNIRIVVCNHKREPFNHVTNVIDTIDFSIAEFTGTGYTISEKLINECSNQIIKLICKYKKSK